MQSVGSTSFTYDKDGIRTTKTTSNGIISYVYNNGKLLAEIRGGEIIYYFYNATGICGARYKGADYVYEKNVFGDVIAVIKNGTDVAQYNYDAWGNVEEVYVNNTDDFAPINPIRYRGYYYDVETNLYYLLTRYYDPTIGQFINPDTPDYLEPETIDGVNLYAYCLNNPVKYFDPTGHTPILQLLISIVCYMRFVVASIWDETVRSDMGAIGWNPFNTNAEASVNATKVSFYKGVTVFIIDNMGGSMSLGAIWLDKDMGVNTLKHERGHNDQFMSMGLIRYLIFIGIPSPILNDDNTPWELSASILGGSDFANRASEEEKEVAMRYYRYASLPIPILWRYNLMLIFHEMLN